MLVLDTHIWLWWMSQAPQLKPDLKQQIVTSEQVGVSSISLFEVAWLVQRQRIVLGCSLEWWFEQALDGSNITLLPITPEIAEKAVSLTEHHSDPQDRLIIATALCHQAKLVSADTKFKLYEELKESLIQ